MRSRASSSDALGDSVAELRRRFPRVAVTHEWLTAPGGSEQVLLEILRLLPHAELFTTIYDPAPWPPEITDRTVHTTVLDRIPGARRRYARLLPLMDRAWRRFDLHGFDLVVSSNHACAKNVRVPDGTPHVCYCHTPMRYAWDPSFVEGEELGLVGRVGFRLLLGHLRRTDRRGAAGVDRFLANSAFVAERVAAAYRREATVLHPPVAIDRFADVARAAAQDAPYLVFGRLVPYKRVEIAIEACLRLGRPLVVAGDGRSRSRLEALAAGSGHVRFLGRVRDRELPELLASSRALLFPGVEDFGIVPVEAQAAGLPVIAYGVGGARESVIDAETGVLYDDPTPTGLVAAIRRFESLRLSDGALRRNAQRFSPSRFREAFAEFLLV